MSAETPATPETPETPTIKFTDLGLTESLLKALRDVGYESPSPIQAATIPPLLAPLTRSVPPVGDGQWRLYNLARDPGETTDLSASEPAVKARLLGEYDAYAKRMGVLSMPEGYDSRAQVNRNIAARLLGNYPWLYGVLGGIALVFVAMFWLALRWLLRRHRAARQA